jgi:hypothetical protein
MSVLFITAMFGVIERRGPGCRSPRVAAVITLAVVCLAAAGCSSVKSAVNSAASAQAPKSATTGSGASGTGLKLTGAPAASAFTSGAAKVVPPNPLGPPADPFTGTPADHWADGAAGIVLPTAAPVGPYTKAQVEYAYQTTRKMLIAAELDKQTLLGGAPTAFADLLTSPQRTMFLSGLNKVGLDKQGLPVSTRGWVMSFPPGEAQLIGSVIKVHGTMRAQASRDNGSPQLDIYADYIFVYPIEPPHQPERWMRIVNEVAWTMEFGYWKGVDSTFAPWMTDTGTIGGVAGANCGSTDGYSHPDYPASATPGPQPSDTPSGTPVDPYVAGRSTDGNCQETTGT